MKNKLIIYTGGGSAGHITPNLALIDKMSREGFQAEYIGSEAIEENIIKKANIPFHKIKSGKLRRYFSWKNFTDFSKVLVGIIQSYFILRKKKPALVFSKGGFVSFPVVFAAYLNRIPVFIHESDYTPGLANKLSFPFATKICLTYEDSQKFVPNKDKILITGCPIREKFYSANRENGLKYLNFQIEKPILMIMGGGLGSALINQTVRTILADLLQTFNIIHLCGAGKVDPSFLQEGYLQKEYLQDEIYDVMAATDLIISRAGSTSVYEFITLKKLNLLIPLSKKASRGDQLDNAKFAETNGLSEVIQEEDLNPELLKSKILTLFREQEKYLNNYQCQNAIEVIFDQIKKIDQLK